MASIDKRPDGSYRARWREYPGGPQKTRSFRRKVDAERHLVEVQHSLLVGTYVDPAKSRATLEMYAAGWLKRMRPTWRQGTYESMETTLRVHVLPVFGKRPLGSIKRADVEAWAASLELAPSTVAQRVSCLARLFAAAVEDGLIPRSPTNRARLPRQTEKRAQPIPVETLTTISDACPDWFRIAVTLGAGVGLRQGEACGLTIDRVDFLRRTLRIDRQLVTYAGPTTALEPPKTHASTRTIPLAQFVVDALAAHIAEHGTGEHGLVLHLPDGRPVTRAALGRAWRPATKKAKCAGVRYHDTRHTFASILLSQGVSVKAVADWLGHANPSVTLNTYAHLMPVDEDRARNVLDRAFSTPRTPIEVAR